jgi:hypothetical protein
MEFSYFPVTRSRHLVYELLQTFRYEINEVRQTITSSRNSFPRNVSQWYCSKVLQTAIILSRVNNNIIGT